MIVKLPVEAKPLITSECWTYHRMAIAQTHPGFSQWAASKFGVHMYDTYEINFGDAFDKQYMQHFSDLLEISEIKIDGISHKEIIEVIKDNINNNCYVLLRCNNYALYGRVDRSFGNHETLIYGFDDEAELIYTLSTWNSNTWHETTASFLNLRIAYNDLLRNYQLYPNEAFDQRGWGYFITKISLKKYLPWSNSVFDFVTWLKKEYDGGILQRVDYQSDELYKVEMYSGFECLRQIKYMLDNSSESNVKENVISNIALSLKKLFEQRTIILSALQWVQTELAITEGMYVSFVDEYRELAGNLQKAYLLIFKYFASNKDYRNVRASCKIIEKNIYMEKQVIERIVSYIRKISIDKISIDYNKVSTSDDPRDDYFTSLGQDKTDVVFYKYH